MKIVLDLRMPDQGHAQRGGQAFAGDVVLGGPQPAGGDDHVGPGEGEPEGLGDARLVVPHSLVMQDVHADLREALRHPLGVVVADLAEEDLGPHPQDFGPHPAGSGLTGGSGRTRRSHGAARIAYWTPVASVNTTAAINSPNRTPCQERPRGRMYRAMAAS